MKKILGVLLCFVFVSADAALVSVDWQTSGDNLITRDTTSGLEWLDLTVTAGMSYDSIVAQMGSGGTYEGWAYTTEAQVATFFDNAGGSGVYTGPSTDHQAVFDSGLLSAWSTTDAGTGYVQAEFLTVEVTGLGSHIAGLIRDGDNPSLDFIDTIGAGYQGDASKSILASALVRTSVVPIPAAVWLFGSALGMLGWMRRKTA